MSLYTPTSNIIKIPALVTALSAAVGQAAVIEEIIVTAQKREQSLNDVSISVNAFGSEDMKRLRIEKANDIAGVVPNLDIKNTLGGVNPAITVRGVGLNDFNANNNPSVGVYVDEVFLASPGMLGFSAFDIERVEVLKGPQGTLYGRNTNGGAINFLTRKPTQEFGAYVTLGFGNYEASEVEAAVGGPLNDHWSGRLSAKYAGQGETFTENADTGTDFGDSETFSVRGQLAFEGDGFRSNIALTVGHQETAFSAFKSQGFGDPATFATDCASAATGMPVQDGSCTSFVFLANGGLGDAEFFPNSDPDSSAYGSGTTVEDTEVDSQDLNVRLAWDLGELTLTSISSYALLERTYVDNTFESPAGYHYFDGVHDEEVEQLSQEIRLSGSGDRVNWVAGVFFSNDEIDSSTLINSTDTLGTLYDITYNQETTAAAAFAHTEWTLTDQLNLVLGLRYSWEERDYVGGTTDLNPTGTSFILFLPPAFGGFGLDPFVGPLDLTASTGYKFSDESISGKIGLDFRPNDDWLIYGSVTTGFKSGIVFADITFSPPEEGPLDPEEITGYEVGFKASLLDQSMQLNAALFYYDYQDIQTQVPTPLGLTFVNADSADITGGEIEVTWLPTEGLELRGAIGSLDTDISNPGLDGNRLPNAPELQYTGIVRYGMPVSEGLRLALQADFKYSDDIFKEATNNPLGKEGDYTVVNARVALSDEDGKWELALWGKNVTDERYREQIFIVDFFKTANGLFNAPPTYGVSFTYNFE